MNILCLIPPYVPSYFNAGHHLPLFTVAAYLRRQPDVTSVTAIDACAMGQTWKEIGSLLGKPFDLVVMLNDFDAIDTFRRAVHYARVLNPAVKLMTFGRLSQQNPQLFEQFGFDAIHCSGDAEAAVAGYVRYLLGQQDAVPGVSLRQADGYSEPTPGTFLLADEWVLPDVAEIPYDGHLRLYADDLNKFCGIPQRRELVIPLARGCPVGCMYCDVPIMQGRRERRLPVDRVIDYIRDAFTRQPFEYVSFYAPTFTLNKQWVHAFCDAVIELGSPWPWKCVTTTFHLSEELVAKMAKSGCVRISIGLETLGAGSASLPKIKQKQGEAFDRVAEWCRQYGVELNCFIILGLPGDTVEGIAYTIEHARSAGARVRPTIYTPYDQITGAMSEHEVAMFNRQLLVEGLWDAETAARFHKIFFHIDGDAPTQVMERIKIRSGDDLPIPQPV
ncbi:MAG TPA: radical SAM protein [Herpetosiphonaceae bacterium]